MPPHVLVAGPVAWNSLIYLDALPEPRPHTIAARRHHETLGGTSAGKALNLRRLGMRVTLRTRLGRDAQGAAARRALQACGVELVADPDGDTERHVNLMDAAGRRLSIHVTRPCDRAGQDDWRVSEVLPGCDAVVVDLADQSRPLLEVAREAGKPVWCDVHDYDGVDAFHADFVDAADYLFLSDDRLPDPVAFMESRARAGARVVVCTRGAAGALAVTDEGVWHEVPAVPVEGLVDSNGAGDAFFAGFLFGHLQDRPVPECLRFGAVAGALCVGSPELASDRLTPATLIAALAETPDR